MADLSDVEDALTALVSQAVYPRGTDSASVVEATCRIFRGWPNSNGLNADLAAGNVNISIVPDTPIGTTTTRFTTSWHADPVPARLTSTVTGETVSFVGEVEVGQLIGVLVDGRSYVYLPIEGDTPSLVAANVGALIMPERPILVSGSSLRIVGAANIAARVVVSTTAFSEVRRQERDLRVILWCPSQAMRDQVASAVDRLIARHPFIELRDQSHARIIYSGTALFDQAQNAQLFRRDLIYTAEYPTILAENLPAMLFGSMSLNAIDIVS